MLYNRTSTTFFLQIEMEKSLFSSPEKSTEADVIIINEFVDSIFVCSRSLMKLSLMTSKEALCGRKYLLVHLLETRT